MRVAERLCAARHLGAPWRRALRWGAGNSRARGPSSAIVSREYHIQTSTRVVFFPAPNIHRLSPPLFLAVTRAPYRAVCSLSLSIFPPSPPEEMEGMPARDEPGPRLRVAGVWEPRGPRANKDVLFCAPARTRCPPASVWGCQCEIARSMQRVRNRPVETGEQEFWGVIFCCLDEASMLSALNWGNGPAFFCVAARLCSQLLRLRPRYWAAVKLNCVGLLVIITPQRSDADSDVACGVTMNNHIRIYTPNGTTVCDDASRRKWEGSG